MTDQTAGSGHPEDDEFARVTDSSWFPPDVDAEIERLLEAATMAIETVEEARVGKCLFTPVVAMSLIEANRCLVDVKALLVQQMGERHPQVIEEARRMGLHPDE